MNNTLLITMSGISWGIINNLIISCSSLGDSSSITLNADVYRQPTRSAAYNQPEPSAARDKMLLDHRRSIARSAVADALLSDGDRKISSR